MSHLVPSGDPRSGLGAATRAAQNQHRHLENLSKGLRGADEECVNPVGRRRAVHIGNPSARPAQEKLSS